MSAVPASAEMANWASKAAHTVHVPKVHPTIPQIGGATFSGTASSKDGSTSNVSMTITSESKSGKLVGFLVLSKDGGSGPKTITLKGSVNVHGAFVFTGLGADHQTVKLTGVVSADAKQVTGKFLSHKPKHQSDSGTFVLSRV
jgi:hypothetical protein